jgi:hypothetical protein
VRIQIEIDPSNFECLRDLDEQWEIESRIRIALANFDRLDFLLRQNETLRSRLVRSCGEIPA